MHTLTRTTTTEMEVTSIRLERELKEKLKEHVRILNMSKDVLKTYFEIHAIGPGITKLDIDNPLPPSLETPTVFPDTRIGRAREETHKNTESKRKALLEVQKEIAYDETFGTDGGKNTKQRRTTKRPITKRKNIQGGDESSMEQLLQEARAVHKQLKQEHEQ
jgi:hypothetical protein